MKPVPRARQTNNKIFYIPVFGYNWATYQDSKIHLGRIAMQKWFAVLGLGTVLAAPVFSQQSAPAANSVENATETQGSSGEVSHSISFATTHQNALLAPAVPRPTPFAAPAAKTMQDSDAPGRLVPRFELAGMYQYVNLSPGDPFDSFGNHGGTGSFTYNASRWLGLTAEFGGYRFHRDVSAV